MMNPIDAELSELYKRAKRFQTNQAPSPGYTTGQIDGFYEGVLYVLDKIAEQSRTPLTLEELREMDREPVWVTPTKASKNWWMPSTVYWDRPKMDAGWWMLVNAGERKCFESHLASAYFSDYGKNWLAYRRRPEEGRT